MMPRNNLGLLREAYLETRTLQSMMEALSVPVPEVVAAIAAAGGSVAGASVAKPLAVGWLEICMDFSTW